MIRTSNTSFQLSSGINSYVKSGCNNMVLANQKYCTITISCAWGNFRLHYEDFQRKLFNDILSLAGNNHMLKDVLFQYEDPF